MAACDYCEVADECAKWQTDSANNPKPQYGACDYESHLEYVIALDEMKESEK